jgi:hypothetical protein
MKNITEPLLLSFLTPISDEQRNVQLQVDNQFYNSRCFVHMPFYKNVSLLVGTCEVIDNKFLNTSEENENG